MEGYTDLYRLGNVILTVVKDWNETLDPLSDPKVVQLVLGSS